MPTRRSFAALVLMMSSFAHGITISLIARLVSFRKPRTACNSCLLDLAAVRSALATIEHVCAGDGAAGDPAGAPMTQRFGFLSAPRSTVVQPGPIHGGTTTDPQAELGRLVERLVGP